LSERPMVVVFTKQDITEVREQTDKIRPVFVARGLRTLAISAVTREGLPELVTTVSRELERLRSANQLDTAAGER
jgi:GTP-binding protein